MKHTRTPRIPLGRFFVLAGILLAFAFVMAPSVAQAGPVAPDPLVLVQPDGSTFEAVPYGDEWANGYETPAGFTVVQEAETGVWYYAEPAAGGGLAPGAVRPDQAATPLAAEPHLRALIENVEVYRTPIDPSAMPGAVQNIGNQPTLVILASFNNRAAVGTGATYWKDSFFGSGDSVRSYYNEVSYGKLNITAAAESHGTANDGVVGWLNMGYNHPNTRGDTGAANLQLARDAISAANPYINYATYDTNGDGYIGANELHVVVIAAGYETSYGGAGDSCTPGLWGHQWALRGQYGVTAPVLDGKTVGYYGYTEFGEWHCRSSDNPGHPATIGIMVHEMGHDLNWPDLYDIDYSSYGVGYWSIMGSGGWLRTSGYAGSKPPHPDAFLKWYQGWLTPVQISGSQANVGMTQAATSSQVIQLRANPAGVDWVFNSRSGAGEYFLVENRQKVGFDAGLPGCGLLIWHIDETRTSTNSTNASDTRRLVDLEEADGLGQIDSKASAGDTGDPFPGSRNNRTFGEGTNPNSRLYAGASSSIQISNISASCAATMRADFSTGAVQTGKRIYVPLMLNQKWIQGTVRYRNAGVGNINLRLFRCDASSCTPVNSTRTAANGAYSFDAPAIGADQVLKVVYENGATGGNTENNSHLAYWASFDIAGVTSASTIPGGNFDIANVALDSPANNATVAIPATFRWLARGVGGDAYSLAFADSGGYEFCFSDLVGGTGLVVNSSAASACGFSTNTTYRWYVYVAAGDWDYGYGLSRFYRNVRFSQVGLQPGLPEAEPPLDVAADVAQMRAGAVRSPIPAPGGLPAPSLP